MAHKEGTGWREDSLGMELFSASQTRAAGGTTSLGIRGDKGVDSGNTILIFGSNSGDANSNSIQFQRQHMQFPRIGEKWKGTWFLKGFNLLIAGACYK